MVVNSVTQLLAGNSELLSQFYRFVPEQYCPKVDYSYPFGADANYILYISAMEL